MKKLSRIAAILCVFTIATGITAVPTLTANAQTDSLRTRIELSNAYLKEIKGIDLDTEFHKNVTEYEAASFIASNIDSINIEAIPENPDASVSIRGANNLKEGLNRISIAVTAPSGSTMNYRIYVEKDEQNKPSSNANLASISGIELDQPFDKDRLQYTASVSADTEYVNINASAEDPFANVRVMGGQYIRPGDNTITINVRAQDHTRKDYTIKVNRGSVSSNTNIVSITGIKLDSEYSNDVSSYTASVPNSVTSVNLDVVAEDENAGITIRGDVNSLGVGRNRIQIIVTAQSGRRKIVTLTVTRQDEHKPSSDASIIKLYGDFELVETFNPNRIKYTIELSEDKRGLEDFIFEIADKKASVEVKGRTAGGGRLHVRPQSEYYGMRSYSIPRIPKGESIISIKVTAADGTKKIYTVRVIKV